MSQIKIQGLSFAYPGSYENIFEGVNLQLDSNWRLGFTGRNGRGKTTLLRLLMGEFQYEGSILATTHFDYFPFEVSNPEEMTLEVMSNLAPAAMDWEIMRELNLLEVDAEILYRSFCTLSQGEQTKCLLCALFLRENQFLLIDEPTNHLDIEGRQALSRYLQKKNGFLLVSHDRRFLDQSVDHILSINKNNIVVEKGNFSSWYANKTLQDQFEISENLRLAKDIHRLKETAKQKASWSDKVEKSKTGNRNSGSKIDRGYVGHKAAKMMQRSKNLENRQNKAIEDKSKLLKNVDKSFPLKISPLPYPKQQLLFLDDVEIAHGGRSLFDPVSFVVNQGDRVWLKGKNGSGKSSILKLILGKDVPHNGLVQIGSNLVISYVSQSTQNLQGSLQDYVQSKNIDSALFRAILNKLDFKREQFDKNIEHYSQGQKKKVLIAGSLSQRAHVYIWDEPLNYVDILSRLQIQELLQTYPCTMIFVEHDAGFSEEVATKIIEL